MSARVALYSRMNIKKSFLIPKGSRSFFSKNTPNLPFLAHEAQINFLFYFFALSNIGSYRRLLGEHVQIFLQKLTAWIVRL
jgi:hypothetical protein